jgi:hypothetical protein
MVPTRPLPPEAPPQGLAIGGLCGLTLVGSFYVATTYDAPWAGRALLAEKDRRDGRRQWAFYLLGVPTGIVIGILTPTVAAWIGKW